MSMEFEGLTKFQEDLLQMAQVKLPKESFKIMRKIGNKATTAVRKEARSKVTKITGNYYKGFKRGKVFKDADGQIVTRVFNSSPHAHLIEYGHRLVTGGQEVGFVTGGGIVSGGIKKFDDSGDFSRMLSEWLDEELDKGNL